ncbi:hypothetical protein ACHAWO_004764 [Cyclotella atomus]|uniref:Bestrophin homolog n=1 Tax=Cyclotella atomus TaxID=382360 RepID=A0ABD3NNT0_9STRA
MLAALLKICRCLCCVRRVYTKKHPSSESEETMLRSKKSLGTRRKHTGEYTVEYNSRSHFDIIFSLRGSIWPNVIKYCLLNVMLTLFCNYVVKPTMEDKFKMTGKGHALLAIVVSFLVVTRVNLALAQYKEARGNLSKMLTSTRDIVSATAIHTKDDQTQSAKEWRNLIAYYSCLLLRLMMAASNYKSQGIPPWSLPELHGEIKEELLKHNQITGLSSKFAHMQRTEREEVYRVPITMCHYLRMALTDNAKYLQKDCSGLPIGRFNGIVDNLIHAYTAQKKIFTTPPPFPMVQMSRTVTFVWVFLLPLVLMEDPSSVLAHSFVVFFVTFAFCGLELVAIEVDDPFGNDDNDFDNTGLALSVYEDVYNIINIIDGEEWAYKVRFNMKDGDGDVFFRPTEVTPLIGV